MNKLNFFFEGKNYRREKLYLLSFNLLHTCTWPQKLTCTWPHASLWPHASSSSSCFTPINHIICIMYCHTCSLLKRSVGRSAGHSRFIYSTGQLSTRSSFCWMILACVHSIYTVSVFDGSMENIFLDPALVRWSAFRAERKAREGGWEGRKELEKVSCGKDMCIYFTRGSSDHPVDKSKKQLTCCWFTA